MQSVNLTQYSRLATEEAHTEFLLGMKNWAWSVLTGNVSKRFAIWKCIARRGEIDALNQLTNLWDILTFWFFNQGQSLKIMFFFIILITVRLPVKWEKSVTGLNFSCLVFGFSFFSFFSNLLPQSMFMHVKVYAFWKLRSESNQP